MLKYLAHRRYNYVDCLVIGMVSILSYNEHYLTAVGVFVVGAFFSIMLELLVQSRD